MKCPHCRQALIRSDEPPYLLWSCRQCGGCAATMAVLRRGIEHEVLRQAWNRTVGENRRVLMPCPACSAMMHRVPTEGPEIDLCRQCQVVWLDAGELEQIPKRTAASLKAEKWEEELRAMQRRRRDSEFYGRIIRWHSRSGFLS